MYYEFYIDVFFVVNLFVNFILLCLTNRLIKGTAIPLRAFLGAFCGTGAICLFVLSAGEIGAVKGVFFYSVTTVFMVRAGCGLKTGKELFFGMITFLAATFLLGGFLTAVPKTAGRGIFLFCVITAAAYEMINAGIKLFRYLKGKEAVQCEVIVALNGKKMKVKGLYDTGNCLVDQKTGKPVSVMEYESFSALLGEGQRRVLEKFCAMEDTGADDESRKFADALKPRFLFYTSVGCEKGLLPVVTADSLTVLSGGRKKQVLCAAVGLSKTTLSSRGNFQIIISPTILDS